MIRVCQCLNGFESTSVTKCPGCGLLAGPKKKFSRPFVPLMPHPACGPDCSKVPPTAELLFPAEFPDRHTTYNPADAVSHFCTKTLGAF